LTVVTRFGWWSGDGDYWRCIGKSRATRVLNRPGQGKRGLHRPADLMPPVTNAEYPQRDITLQQSWRLYWKMKMKMSSSPASLTVARYSIPVLSRCVSNLFRWMRLWIVPKMNAKQLVNNMRGMYVQVAVCVKHLTVKCKKN